jgi:NAD-dependent deacetylase
MLERAVEILKAAKHAVAFTGAGISVESGIPPFRGEHGLWDRYDPQFLEIDFFKDNPAASWRVIKEIFYDFVGTASPNAAHHALAWLEQTGRLRAVVTQNIDNLHYEAGSQRVYELHGNISRLVCLRCAEYFPREGLDLEQLPPLCGSCGGLLKPALTFFGEALPPVAYEAAVREAEAADALLIVGTTGEVMPAAMIPYIAKTHGAKLIEINVGPSRLTELLTDVFLEGKATEVMTRLRAAMQD